MRSNIKFQWVEPNYLAKDLYSNGRIKTFVDLIQFYLHINSMSFELLIETKQKLRLMFKFNTPKKSFISSKRLTLTKLR